MPCDGSTRRSSPNRERRGSSHARVQLAATETIRVRAATAIEGEAGRVCLGFIKFCARALNWAEADETDIAGRAAKCAATGSLPPKSTTPPAPAKPLTLFGSPSSAQNAIGSGGTVGGARQLFVRATTSDQ